MNNTLLLNPPFIFRRTSSFKWEISFKIFFILLLFLLLVLYVFQVNAEVSERYLIQKYEKEISKISKENQNLEVKTIKSNSLDNITELLKPLNFQKTDKIYYIRVLETKVVTK